MAITATEARKKLFQLIRLVNDDRSYVEITSKSGDAVLMSRADFAALKETAYLLRVPANAQRLLESLAQTDTRAQIKPACRRHHLRSEEHRSHRA